MKETRLKYLIEQFVAGRITEAERHELGTFLQNTEDEALVEIAQGILTTEEETVSAPHLTADQQRAMLHSILSMDKSDGLHEQLPVRKWLIPKKVLRWVAAASIVLALGWAASRLWLPQDGRIAHHANSPYTSAVGYVRNITLPDGSMVVLQAGSTLDFPEVFDADVREVRLSGEAFFDVSHAQARKNGKGRAPFVIHTGKIRTVVLGTAFNIRAYPGRRQITVSVTRGKVRVEDQTRVLAVLTPDQQVTYNEDSAIALTDQIDAVKTRDWTATEMSFDGVTFGRIASALEKRYNIAITFSNPALKECLLVSSFTGSETLENVLEALCTISNTTYRLNTPQSVEIDGRGCP